MKTNMSLDPSKKQLADKSDIVANERPLYRISILYRLASIGVLGICILGELGYLGPRLPGMEAFRPLFTFVFVGVCLLLVLLAIIAPYRNNCIEFYDEHLVLPSLFIPPYRKKIIKYRDILAIDYVIGAPKTSSFIRLRLTDGQQKISSNFCFDDKPTWDSPEWKALCQALKRHLPNLDLSIKYF
jgi:hypothetical protein